MSSEYAPRVSIGGVSLDVESFAWPLRVGAASGSTVVEVHADIGADLYRFMVSLSPQVLKVETDVQPGHFSGSLDVQTFTASTVYVVEELPPSNRFLRSFRIADFRYLLEQEIVTRSYNVRRKTNAPKIAPQVRLGAALPGGSPADFEIISTFRYLPGSLREKASPLDNPRHLRGFNAAAGEPWTASAILMDLLRDYRKHTTIDTRRMSRGEYQPENFVIEGQSLVASVNAMLAASRNSMFVRPEDGVLEIFGLDETPVDKIFPPPFPYEGSGWPIVPDLKARRPGKIEVQFVQEHEIRFNYDEATRAQAGDVVIGAVPDFELDNVVQLPESVGGITRGTWVTIQKALDLWAEDGENPLPAKIQAYSKLTLEAIRKRYLTSFLEYFAFDPTYPGHFNPIWQRRISAIRSSFRRIFRILPAWMDRIESWRPELVSVVDDVTHQRQSAMVFQDYCVIPAMKLGHIPAEFGDGKAIKTAQNVRVFPEDGGDISIESGRRVPATLSPVDADLGIFSIGFFEDLQRNYAQIVPSAIDNIPVVAFDQIGSIIWSQSSLAESFRLSVVLSVIFSTPNNEGRLYKISHTPGEFGNADGNPAREKEILSRRQNAGYKATDRTRARLTAEGVEVTGSELVNEDILKGIAAAEAEREFYRWKDRPTGVYLLTGYQARDFFPAGSARQVTIKFDQGGITTGVDMSEPPAPISIQELLPSSVKRFLFKQLPRE